MCLQKPKNATAGCFHYPVRVQKNAAPRRVDGSRPAAGTGCGARAFARRGRMPGASAARRDASHSRRDRPSRPRRRRSFLERASSGSSHVRTYVSRSRGADKFAIAAWLLVDYAWCQEEEIGVVAAAFVFISVSYKLSIGTHSPHELTHCAAVMLWVSGNVSWMWMEFGQARLRATSHFRGPGAAQEDWMNFKLASLALFFLAFVVEMTYFAFLRHTPMFEEDWSRNPLTAAVVARHTRRMSQSSGQTGGSSVFSHQSWSDTGSVSSAAPSDATHDTKTYGAERGPDGAKPVTFPDDPDDDANAGAKEMVGILPRWPSYFKTWDDYESVAIMVWILKDFNWMFYTKFTKSEDEHGAVASRAVWTACSVLLLLLHADFLVAAATQTEGNVEWINYLCLLLWAISQTLWAGGELYFHESVTLREPTFEAPENLSHPDLRWIAGWFIFAGVTILYGYWAVRLVVEVSGWCADEDHGDADELLPEGNEDEEEAAQK